MYISNSLPTTASYHVEQPMVEVPFDLSGTLRLFVVTDDGDIVDENGLESNNLASLGTIDVDLLGTLPDLLVHQVNAPIESISGQSFDLTWSVRNLGDFIPQEGPLPPEASSSWTDAVFLSRTRSLTRRPTRSWVRRPFFARSWSTSRTRVRRFRGM